MMVAVAPSRKSRSIGDPLKMACAPPISSAERLAAATASPTTYLCFEVGRLDPRRLSLLIRKPRGIAQQPARRFELGAHDRHATADIGGGRERLPVPLWLALPAVLCNGPQDREAHTQIHRRVGQISRRLVGR